MATTTIVAPEWHAFNVDAHANVPNGYLFEWHLYATPDGGHETKARYGHDLDLTLAPMSIQVSYRIVLMWWHRSSGWTHFGTYKSALETRVTNSGQTLELIGKHRPTGREYFWVTANVWDLPTLAANESIFYSREGAFEGGKHRESTIDEGLFIAGFSHEKCSATLNVVGFEHSGNILDIEVGIEVEDCRHSAGVFETLVTYDDDKGVEKTIEPNGTWRLQGTKEGVTTESYSFPDAFTVKTIEISKCYCTCVE